MILRSIFGGGGGSGGPENTSSVQTTVSSSNSTYDSAAKVPAGAVIHMVVLSMVSGYTGATLAVSVAGTTVVAASTDFDPTLASDQVWHGRVVVASEGNLRVTIASSSGGGSCIVTAFYSIPKV